MWPYMPEGWCVNLHSQHNHDVVYSFSIPNLIKLGERGEFKRKNKESDKYAAVTCLLRIDCKKSKHVKPWSIFNRTYLRRATLVLWFVKTEKLRGSICHVASASILRSPSSLCDVLFPAASLKKTIKYSYSLKLTLPQGCNWRGWGCSAVASDSSEQNRRSSKWGDKMHVLK